MAPLTPRTLYLTTYNALSFTLWSSLLYTTLTHTFTSTSTSSNNAQIFASTSTRAQWTQTLSMIEILHSAFGLVKSPTATTALQVSTRTIQVWMIWHCFPGSTAVSSAYWWLLMAWALADTVRYAFLGLGVWGVKPGWLLWLRYVAC